jgi:hypothetical protein
MGVEGLSKKKIFGRPLSLITLPTLTGCFAKAQKSLSIAIFGPLAGQKLQKTSFCAIGTS